MKKAGVWGWTGLLTAGYLALALSFTSPLWRFFSTRCWGTRFDLWSNLWLFWYFGRCLQSGHWEMSTRLLLYPQGQDLLRTYAHLGLFVFASPFQLALGPTRTMNLFLVGSLVASALAMAWLVTLITGSRSAGAVAGALFALNPFVLSEMSMGSVEMVALEWIPLSLVFLIRLQRRTHWYDGAGLAASIIIGCLWNWLLGVILLALVGAYLLWSLYDPDSHRFNPTLIRRAFPWLLGACVILLVLVLPLAKTLAPSGFGPLQASDFSVQNQRRNQEINMGDVPALVLSNEDFRIHRAISMMTSSYSPRDLLFHGYNPRPVWGAFSLMFLALALAGCVWSGRRKWFWILVALAGTVLSLGPFLTYPSTEPGVQWVGTPLPFLFLHNHLPLGIFLVRPYRFVLLALVGGCVLAGFAIKALLTSSATRTRVVVVILLVLAVQAEMWVPMPPGAPRPLADTVGKYFTQEVEGEASGTPAPNSTGIVPGAWVELPLEVMPIRNQQGEVMYRQIFHHHPLLNAIFQREWLITQIQDLARGNSVIAALIDASGPLPKGNWRVRRRDLRALSDQGFTRALVRTRLPLEPFYEAFTRRTQPAEMAKEPLLDLLEDLYGPPRTEAEGIRAYDMRFNPDENPDEFRDLRARAVHPLRFADPQGGGIGSRAGDSIEIMPQPGPGPSSLTLYLNPPPAQVQRLVFWTGCMESTSLRVVLVTHAGKGARRWITDRRLLPLSWERQAISATDLAPLVPGGEGEPFSWGDLQAIELEWQGRQPLRLVGFKLVNANPPGQAPPRALHHKGGQEPVLAEVRP